MTMQAMKASETKVKDTRERGGMRRTLCSDLQERPAGKAHVLLYLILARWRVVVVVVMVGSGGWGAGPGLLSAALGGLPPAPAAGHTCLSRMPEPKFPPTPTPAGVSPFLSPRRAGTGMQRE